jgi:hypothetical protein
MKLVTILAAVLLSGCAGLSVNFDASYRSDVPLGQRAK